MRDELYERLCRLSASFVPEWRFDGQGGDLGSGLAQLFLWMQEDSRRRFDELPEYLRAGFFKSFELEPGKAEPSEGYLTCNLVKDTAPEELLKAGTAAVAQKENGERVRFILLEDLYVTRTAVEQVRSDQGMWYVRLTNQPEDGILNLLLLMENPGNGKYHLTLEYFGGSGWKAVSMADGTEGLLHSGMIKFAGRQNYSSFSGFGEEGLFLRLRDSKDRPLPKNPASIYLNGVRVKAEEGGQHTVIPPGTSLKLEETRGFVSRIENPDPLSGGFDGETEEEAGERLAKRFLHRNRAVAPGDFENLAREAWPGILKVRCYVGLDESGNPNPGHVTLAVLMKDGPAGSRLFFQASQQIYGCLRGSMTAGLAGGGKLHITAPLMVRMEVTARIEVRRLEDFMRIREEVCKALDCYLDPYGGWTLGNLPGLEGIRHVFGTNPDILSVRRICVSCFIRREGELIEVDLETIRRFPWVLPESGSHQLLLNG